MKRRLKDHTINGVTVHTNGKGGCYCEKHMTHRNKSKKWKSCYLPTTKPNPKPHPKSPSKLIISSYHLIKGTMKAIKMVISINRINFNNIPKLMFCSYLSIQIC